MTLSYFIGGAIAIFFAIMIFKSIKAVIKIILNTLAGGLVIYILNIFLSQTQFEIILNPIHAFIVGALGLPGIIILYVLKLLR